MAVERLTQQRWGREGERDKVIHLRSIMATVLGWLVVPQYQNVIWPKTGLHLTMITPGLAEHRPQ
jgi:hypothetical protein